MKFNKTSIYMFYQIGMWYAKASLRICLPVVRDRSKVNYSCVLSSKILILLIC